MARIIIAGQALYDQIQAEKLAAGPQGVGGFRSDALCEFQKKLSRRGVTEIEVVKSMYGFSVRYASGLQDFALLLPARGRSDPSLEFAEEWCRKWVAASPSNRYATRSESEA